MANPSVAFDPTSAKPLTPPTPAPSSGTFDPSTATASTAGAFDPSSAKTIARRQTSIYDKPVAEKGTINYEGGTGSELGRAQPQTKKLASELSQYVPGFSTITSVISGPHKGSAHGQGRALDLAPAFQIGNNPQTKQAVANLILSGRIEALGTEASIVNDPELKKLAAAHNVDLFQDDVHTGATGPHFHIQVPSAGSSEARFRGQSSIYREPTGAYGQQPFEPVPKKQVAQTSPSPTPVTLSSHYQEAGGINKRMISGGYYNLLRAGTDVMKAFDSVAGGLQRVASGTMTSGGDLGHGLDVALHPYNQTKQSTNIDQTEKIPYVNAVEHAADWLAGITHLSQGLKALGSFYDQHAQQIANLETQEGRILDPNFQVPEPLVRSFARTMTGLGSGDPAVTKASHALLAQLITDPLTVIPVIGQLKRIGAVRDLLGVAAVAAKAGAGKVPGVESAIRLADAMHQSGIARATKFIFGQRPELDEHLDETGKAARLSIEDQHLQAEYRQAHADAQLLKTNEAALRNLKYVPPTTPSGAIYDMQRELDAAEQRGDFATAHDLGAHLSQLQETAGGHYEIPEDIRQRYLAEPYVEGTPEMRQQALEQGFNPKLAVAKGIITKEQAAAQPRSILHYNVRQDYQTLIRPKNKGDEFAVFQGTGAKYGKAYDGFEKAQVKEGGLGSDQFDIVANRLRLGRQLVRYRAVDMDTAKFLDQYGGWIGHGDPNVGALSQSPWKVRTKITGRGMKASDDADFSLGARGVDPARFLAQLGKAGIKINPLPHAVRNVGMLAYLAGGPEAFGRGLSYALHGINASMKARLEKMGVSVDYLQTAGDGPLGQVFDKAIEPQQALLTRLELGYRQARLDQLDRELGPSELPDGSIDLAKEYRKAQIIRDDLGDYRNVSRFVAGLQAIGGPFVAFRLGIVPKAVARAIRNRPDRVENLARGQVDLNQELHKEGKSYQVEMGGPVTDALSLALKPIDYLTSQSSAGPLAYPLELWKGRGLGQVGDEALTGYVPGLRTVTGPMGFPYKNPAGVSPFMAGLASVLGPYFRRPVSGKTLKKYKRQSKL